MLASRGNVLAKKLQSSYSDPWAAAAIAQPVFLTSTFEQIIGDPGRELFGVGHACKSRSLIRRICGRGRQFTDSPVLRVMDEQMFRLRAS
jgi:hypothetical protein